MNINDVLEQPLAEMASSTGTVAGGDYLSLFKLALANGFSDTDFKKFLADRNITIEKSEPVSQGAFKLH